MTNLVNTVSQRHQVVAVAPDRDLGDSEPFPGLSGRMLTRGNARVFYVSGSSPRQWTSLLRQLSSQQFDLIVVNSVWDPRYALLPVVLKSIRVLHGPVLLLPRGELEPGALALKQWRKRLAGPAFRSAYRHGVSLFGALFTWLMIFVTHFGFRRAHPAAAFRMPFYPWSTGLGAALVVAVLLTTAFTHEFRMTLPYGALALGLLLLAARRAV